MPNISEKDVALLCALATAKGGQGKGKARDADIIQHRLLGIIERIVVDDVWKKAFEAVESDITSYEPNNPIDYDMHAWLADSFATARKTAEAPSADH